MDILFLWAGLAIGLAGLWVGIGEGIVANKAIKLMGKDPEMMNSLLVLTVLGIALVESAAIYGLIISLQIISLDPETFLIAQKAIGAGLAVGAAGLGAGIGEGLLVSGSLGAIQRNPAVKSKIMTFMILFLALIESVAIYGLVIALSLLK